MRAEGADTWVQGQAVGVQLLTNQRAVTFGLIGGDLFLIGITPLRVLTLANSVLAVALAYLLTKAFDRSSLDIVRAKRRPSVRRVGEPSASNRQLTAR